MQQYQIGLVVGKVTLVQLLSEYPSFNLSRLFLLCSLFLFPHRSRRYVLRATLNKAHLHKPVIFTSFMKVYICSRHFACNAPYSLFVSKFLHETTRTLTSYSCYMSVDNTVQNFILLACSVF